MTPFSRDDRAVSVAVTHVLAIGIVTILLTGLLISAGNVLDNQKRSSAQEELDTVGNRLASEIASIDRTTTPGADETVRLDTDHPDRVTGSTYRVELVANDDSADCNGPLVDDPDACLVLSTSVLDDDRIVPVDVSGDVSVADSSASGGQVQVVYQDGEISIENQS